MDLTILEILYLVLIVFSSVIWTLLIIVLIRLLKILWPVMEIVQVYNKIKQVFKAYASIPEQMKDSVMDLFKDKKDKSK